MTNGVTRLRLLSRPDCHLCEEMARDLSRLRLSFATIDVELDEELERAYGESIPVLMFGEREIARAPQTAASLERALRRAGVLPDGGPAIHDGR